MVWSLYDRDLRHEKCKYPHGQKSNNGHGRMRITSFMEMVFPSRFSYFPSKNYRELDFFVMAREISKSDFLTIFLQTAEESY